MSETEGRILCLHSFDLRWQMISYIATLSWASFGGGMVVAALSMDIGG